MPFGKDTTAALGSGKGVFKTIGTSPGAFCKEVRFHPEFIGAIAELGVVERGKGVRFNAFAYMG
jgi:hypothetical protein